MSDCKNCSHSFGDHYESLCDWCDLCEHEPINNKKVKMRQNILNEELGISNAVNSLVIRLKNLISNNYSKNNDDTKKYVLLGGVNKYIVFTNIISVNFENKDIDVEYYVLNHKSEKVKQSFIKEYHSNCSNEILKITLYLTLNNNDKIDWLSCSLDLQHEVEHLFQLYKKEKPIFSNKKIEKYIDELERIENIIEGIEDEVVRVIARMRFVECCKWRDIAKKVRYDESVCYRKLKKYFEEGG